MNRRFTKFALGIIRQVLTFQGDFTQTIVLWGDQRLTIRGTMEPLAEGSEAFMTVEPRRVVLLEA